MPENISLKNFLESNYSSYLDTITNLSRSNKKEFIIDSRKLYNFDKMICEFYNEQNKPKSADALFILENSILFIEFKTGFKDNVKIKNLNENEYCNNCYDEIIYAICNEKFKYFIQSKKLSKEDKKKGLFLKIAESYIIFKTQLLPKYLNEAYFNNSNYKFLFWIVIDNPVDAIHISYKKNNNYNDEKNNILIDIQNSIKRFYDKHNLSYYDEILVLNQYTFLDKINKFFN